MKKLFGILLMVLAVVPLVSAYAIEGNYYEYSVGDEVNFYTYEGDQKGTRTIIIQDGGADQQYVRVLVTGFVSTTNLPWAEEIDTTPEDFTSLPNYNTLQSDIQQKLNGASYIRNVETETSLLTLDDLINIFGATPNGDGSVYTFDWAKWGKAFQYVYTSADGMFTQTLTADKKNVWVIKFQKNGQGEVTGATIEQEKAMVAAGEAYSATYAMMPVVWMDKTYDCREPSGKDKFACYKCGDDYQWLEIGTQDSSCKKIDKIKAETSCVKNPTMGVSQYFAQFGILAGICAIALVAVNRKSLFRNI